MIKIAVFTSETDGLAKNWSPTVLKLLLPLLIISKGLQLLTISSIPIITSIITYMSYMYIVHILCTYYTLIVHVLYSCPIILQPTTFSRGVGKHRGYPFYV